MKSALAYKQSRLMFVPTAFWVDESYTQRKSVNSQVQPLADRDLATILSLLSPPPFSFSLFTAAHLSAGGANFEERIGVLNDGLQFMPRL